MSSRRSKKRAELITPSRGETLAAANDFEQLEMDRAQRLEALNKDKVFQVETAKQITALKDLLRRKPDAVRSFFRGFAYQMVYRPEKWQDLLSRVKDAEAVAILREYLKYATRFQVRLQLRNSSFQVIVYAPYRSKFHVHVVDGHIEPDIARAQGAGRTRLRRSFRG